MAPSVRMLPATLPALKTRRPERKSSLVMLSVDATSPFTSTCAPAPKTTPFGLMRKTRPFDCRAQRICEGSWPTMRFRTALDEPCCRKRVVSPGRIVKFCQLMIVPGVLAIVSRLPLLLKTALPLTTAPPAGLAHAGPCARLAATARRTSLLNLIGAIPLVRQAHFEVDAVVSLGVHGTRIDHVADVQRQRHVPAHRRAHARADAADGSMRRLTGQCIVSRDTRRVVEREHAAEHRGALPSPAQIRRVDLGASGNSLV